MEVYPIKWNFRDIPYGPDPSQTFDIIIPKEKAVHVIIYIHGGAYLIGDKSQYPSFLAYYSEKNVIAAINYRVIEQNSRVNINDILFDINSALLKIIELLGKNKVSIKDFILIGHSAGGHLGLLYGYKNNHLKIRIASCISLSGPTDFTDDLGWSSMTMWGENLETRLLFLSELGSCLCGHTIKLTQFNWTKQKNYPDFKKYVIKISPIMYISKSKTPPTLMVHARSDNQVPYSNSLRLKMTLDRFSVPNKLITPTGIGDNHNLGGIAFTSTSRLILEDQIWVDEAKKWLEGYLD